MSDSIQAIKNHIPGLSFSQCEVVERLYKEYFMGCFVPCGWSVYIRSECWDNGISARVAEDVALSRYEGWARAMFEEVTE